MKRYSTIFILRALKVKITLRHHFSSMRLENIKKIFTTHSVNEAVGKIDAVTHAGENPNCYHS